MSIKSWFTTLEDIYDSNMITLYPYVKSTQVAAEIPPLHHEGQGRGPFLLPWKAFSRLIIQQQQLVKLQQPQHGGLYHRHVLQLLLPHAVAAKVLLMSGISLSCSIQMIRNVITFRTATPKIVSGGQRPWSYTIGIRHRWMWLQWPRLLSLSCNKCLTTGFLHSSHDPILDIFSF